MTPGRSAVLVCEGGCNPSRPAVDDAVRAARRRLDALGAHATVSHFRVVRIADGMDVGAIAAARALRHTVHMQAVPDRRWICLACGTGRQFGEA